MVVNFEVHRLCGDTRLVRLVLKQSMDIYLDMYAKQLQTKAHEK